MSVSKYAAIADTLRNRIADGTYPVGSKLPSIIDLMDEFNARGVNTVRHAQQVLVREGVLRTEQGLGAFVTARKSPTADRAQLLESLRSARAELDRAITHLEEQKHS